MAFFTWAIGPVERKRRRLMPIELSLTTGQKVRLHAVPRTARGVPLPDPVTFAVVSGDSTLVAVDSQSVDIVPSDVPGDTVISATDNGVTETATVHVLPETVATIELTADAPVPK